MYRRHIYTVRAGFACLIVAALTIVPLVHAESRPTLQCDATALFCPASTNHQLADQLANLKVPAITGPAAPKARTVAYQVASKGTITADWATFTTQVAETLNDPRGWSRLGVHFQQVDSGGQFTIVLTQAQLVPSFGSICDDYYSCTIGNTIAENQDRWLNATPPWNQAGGSLRDYRSMLVNHELGHWLGHGHEPCGGLGQPAPVMRQQSIDLQGCVFNPWPLQSELWSTTLRINR